MKIFTTLYWFLVLCFVSVFTTGQKDNIHYYKSGGYDSFTEVVLELFNKNSINGLFQWCCDILQYVAIQIGYTYEELNIIIFVILQPAMILYLFILCVHQRYKLGRLNNRGIVNV